MKDKNCTDCSDHKCCKQAFSHDENSPAASIVQVILAFLVPIVVFVAVKLGCDYLLPNFGKRGDLRSLTGFVIAAIATVAVLYIIKMINQRLAKNK